jgi:alpha-galactosidase
VAVFNYNTAPAAINIDFKQIGLEPNTTYKAVELFEKTAQEFTAKNPIAFEQAGAKLLEIAL